MPLCVALRCSNLARRLWRLFRHYQGRGADAAAGIPVEAIENLLVDFRLLYFDVDGDGEVTEAEAMAAMELVPGLLRRTHKGHVR